jgi:GNAT superfamily N-acetyltransferase
MIQTMLDAGIQESHSQFLAFWKKIVEAMESPVVETAPGLHCLFGCVPIPFFNAVYMDEPVKDGADLDARLTHALAFAIRNPYPWYFFAADEATPDDLQAYRDSTFARAGLQPAMMLTGMIADSLPAATAVPDLEMRAADDGDGFAAVGEINSLAYEMPSGAGAGIMDRHGIYQGGHAVVGHHNGEAVSCAHTATLDGRLYVALVATLPAHRRKGYAEACMRQSLHAASNATGITRSVLHATDLGKPIYARMGYRPVTTYTVFGQAH